MLLSLTLREGSTLSFLFSSYFSTGFSKY